MGNVLIMENAFRYGFFAFLKQVEMVNLKDEEADEAMDYLKKHLQGEVGLWLESEVTNQLKNWRLDQEKPKEVEITAGVYPYGSGQVIGVGKFKAGQEVKLAAMSAEGFEFDCWQGINDHSNPLVITAEFTMEFTARFRQKKTTKPPVGQPSHDKKQVAMLKVKYINSIEKAKRVLEKIVEAGDETIINIIEKEL